MKINIHFNDDLKGTVPVASNFETAKVVVPADNEIFKTATNLFIKEYSSLTLSGTAKAIFKDKDGDDVSFKYFWHKLDKDYATAYYKAVWRATKGKGSDTFKIGDVEYFTQGGRKKG